MALSLGAGTILEFYTEETKALELGDKRLNSRAVKIFTELNKKLSSCIRRVFLEPKEARQAYDFF